MAKKPDRPLSAAQLTLNLTQTTSFEDRDDASHATGNLNPSTLISVTSIAATGAVVPPGICTTYPATISEELCEQCPMTNEPLVDANSAHIKNLNIITKKSEQPESTVNLSETIKWPSGLTPSSSSLAVISNANTPATTPSYGTTPTINVVCPLGEEEKLEHPLDTMDIDQFQEHLAEESATNSDTLDDAMQTSDLDQLDVIEVGTIPQEELSPTTEEYQECCPPDDYQYDISTEGEILVPGCVAPAPTPAPSIAPLAEVEVDPPDDDLDAEELEDVVPGAVGQRAGTKLSSQNDVATEDVDANNQYIEQTKRKRKKRNSESKLEKDSPCAVLEPPQIVETTQMETDTPSRNAVCPWEDE